MKNTKYILCVFVMAAYVDTTAQIQHVEANNASIIWNARKVTGSHTGTIALKEGYLNWEHGQIKTGKFVVDMQSIKDTDLQDESYNQKLVSHLKSEDFFYAEKFPEAILEITESSPFVNNKTQVKANLTIRGITHPVEFEVIKNGDKLMTELIIDRSKYNVRYNSKSFFKNLGDKLVYDDFTLQVTITK